ncbi:7229_t:CDS:1 [Ambispora leptoticha]|uniref:7229_t:CDS:1 n=1 Tax=Ambispora leptoticha TaxID=144679 RepID=A0A9N9C070_9GLOM|nr:7229_t:CDS:1 [Ambispora leptoticha]
MSLLDKVGLFESEQSYISIIFTYIFLYVSIFYFRYYLDTNRLPGPVPFPIVGNLPHLILSLLYARFNLSQVIQILHVKYGELFQLDIPFSFRDPVVVISNAQIADLLFDSTSVAKSKFHLRTSPRQGIDELGISRKGLYFNKDTESWVRNRKFLANGISSVDVAKDCVVYARKAFKEMEKSWIEIESFNEEHYRVANVNIREWIFRWTTDIIFKVTTSENVNSIQTYKKTILETINIDNEKSGINSSFKKLAKSLSIAITDDESRSRRIIDTERFIQNIQDFFPAVWTFLATPKWTRDYVPHVSTMARRFKESLGMVNKELAKIVKEKREEIRINRSQAKEVKMDFLTMMITFEKDKVTLSDDDIRENLLHTMADGINTVSYYGAKTNPFL